MSVASLAKWVLYALTMMLISYMVLVDLRYTFRRRRSKNWPTTAAIIDSGIVGFRGPLSHLPNILHRVHFTYSYRVDGLEHQGRFFLLVDSKTVGEDLRQKLVGRTVPVKYDDRKPDVALLTDGELSGKRVMQGPL